ncbi:hypothetical protein [Mobilicoccus massiliensis]|uniref:hypothetical protein n=1 Tax=Mobilicoccus massiliensis TaxID=1522310 RepID=UPI00058D1B61|nr:hypothetical protein [Mobilicoccus massiliensis]
MSVALANPPTDPFVIDVFRRSLGELWFQVAPLCQGVDDPTVLDATLRARADSEGSHLVHELEALLVGWPHYDSAQRAVLTAAVAYVAGTVPGDHEAIVVDGDKVIDAAVRSILRSS